MWLRRSGDPSHRLPQTTNSRVSGRKGGTEAFPRGTSKPLCIVGVHERTAPPSCWEMCRRTAAPQSLPSAQCTLDHDRSPCTESRGQRRSLATARHRQKPEPHTDRGGPKRVARKLCPVPQTCRATNSAPKERSYALLGALPHTSSDHELIVCRFYSLRVERTSHPHTGMMCLRAIWHVQLGIHNS